MATSVQLDKFKHTFKDGARPNRFSVTVMGNQAGASWAQEPLSYLVKTFSLPAREVGEIVVNHQGMQTKIAGDPTFADVTMTIHNDYAWKAKSYFEKYLEGIAKVNTDGTNTRTAPIQYKCDIFVEQLGRQGEVLASYTIKGAYPKSIDAVELSHESTDTLEEVSITFGIDYWYAGGGDPLSNAGGADESPL